MVKISSRDRFRSSYLKDLSEGGLFVKTEKALNPGAELVIDLLPPGFTDTVRLKGVVVRSDKTPNAAGMAVRFEGNDDATMAVLKTLVAEYQSGASPPLVTEEAAQDQLQRLLNQIAELKNSLARRDAELSTERTRREESTKRAVTLAAELEIVKGRSTDSSPSSTDRLRELETELSTSQREEMELRTRLAEVEGELEAFKHEIETLEQDDATSRRLASSLAKEKAELTSENGKLSAQLNDVKQRLKEATRLNEEHATALESHHQATQQLTDKLRAATTEADTVRLRLSSLEARATTAEADLAGTKQNLEKAEHELATARVELQNMTRRATTAENATKDALARARRHARASRFVAQGVTAARARSPRPRPVVDGRRGRCVVAEHCALGEAGHPAASAHAGRTGRE